MNRSSLVAPTVALILGVVVSGVLGWWIVDAARSSADTEVAAATAMTNAAIAGGSAPEAVLASFQAVPAIGSATLHRANGQLVAEYRRPGEAAGLAARVAPPEVACSSVFLQPGVPATLCIESSPAAVAPAVRTALILGGVITGTMLLTGVLGTALVARASRESLRHIAEVVDKAAREHAYSVRVDAGRTDAKLAASLNDLLAQMQERDVILRRRTTEIEAVNKDLESFAYSVSHDLRAPLGSIDGFVQAIELDHADKLDPTAQEYLGWIREGCRQMRDLIDGMLQMTRLTRIEVQRETVDLSAIAHSVASALQQTNPARPVTFDIRDGVRTVGDERLLRAVIENLMANAWKFTRDRPNARIEFGAADGAFYVRDNGAGFDPTHADKMFRPFQRLHSSREFEGTGIGLATVQKIVERHGGRAWAEGDIGRGATVYFTTAGAPEAVPA